MPAAHFVTCDLDLWLFDLSVNAWRNPAMENMCTSLMWIARRFSFRAWTHGHIKSQMTLINLPTHWLLPVWIISDQKWKKCFPVFYLHHLDAHSMPSTYLSHTLQSCSSIPQNCNCSYATTKCTFMKFEDNPCLYNTNIHTALSTLPRNLNHVMAKITVAKKK